MDPKLDTHIECLIFVSQLPIRREEIRYNLENALQVKLDADDIENALENLKHKYRDDHFAIEIVEVADGFQFVTKGAYHHIAGHYLKQLTKKRLSKVALETLAIIAYRQPVSRAEIEQIRGVNADYAIEKLLEKELIEITGRSPGPGKPLLYATSGKFMDHFGLKSMDDLPKLKEFQMPEEEIGEPSPLEEIVSFDQPGHSESFATDESE